MINHVGDILAVLLSILILFDRFSSRVTPIELEKTKTEILEKVATLYPNKDALTNLIISINELKEMVKPIYEHYLQEKGKHE